MNINSLLHKTLGKQTFCYDWCECFHKYWHVFTLLHRWYMNRSVHVLNNILSFIRAQSLNIRCSCVCVCVFVFCNLRAQTHQHMCDCVEKYRHNISSAAAITSKPKQIKSIDRQIYPWDAKEAMFFWSVFRMWLMSNWWELKENCHRQSCTAFHQLAPVWHNARALNEPEKHRLFCISMIKMYSCVLLTTCKWISRKKEFLCIRCSFQYLLLTKKIKFVDEDEATTVNPNTRFENYPML